MIAVSRESLRRVADGSISVLALALSLLVFYYAQSFYAVVTLHAALVLGLSLAIHYVRTFRDFVAESERPSTVTPSEPGDDTTEPETDATPAYSAFSLPPLDGLFDPDGALGRVHAALAGARVRYDRLATRFVSRVAVALPVFYAVAAALALLSALYVAVEFDRLLHDAPVVGLTTLDYAVGVVVLALVVDVTRRAFGAVMGGVTVAGLAYGLVGPILPGVFHHAGFSPRQLVRVAAMGLGGVYGFILEVGATWVAVFLLIAGLAKSYGVLDAIVEASRAIGRRTRSGVVHAAVFASLGFGSVAGSGAANTATTGQFTIPMMKEQGVDGASAGAIETVASVGGQLVPPVMGVAAFLIADIVGVPYIRIVQAGLLPAALFYLSVVVAVQVLLYKHDWTTPVERGVDPRLFIELLWYVIPFAVLLYLLSVPQYDPLVAGYYTAFVLIALGSVKYVLERGREGPKTAVVRTAEGLKQGAVDAAPLIVVLAAIGVLVGVFTRTGFAQRLDSLLIAVSGGSLLLLLLLAMVVSLLFGLGVPAPAAYILTASLVAVAMTRAGIGAVTAHVFVFYFAMYASLTPPVGPSTVIASRLADAPYVETAKRSLLVAAPGFLIPFAFVANDSLIDWAYPRTLLIFATVSICLTGVVMTLAAHDGRNDLSRPLRGLYLALALLGVFGTSVGLFETYLAQVAVAVALLVVIAAKYSTILDGGAFRLPTSSR